MMTPENCERVSAHLKNLNVICPACSGHRLEPGDLMVYATLHPGGLVHPERVRAVAQVLCRDCHCVLVFCAVRLGLDV